MPSFSIPLTGLQADSTALNTIANNLSNMNTTAYKAQHVTFSDLFYQQIGSSGSGNPLQLGGGTQVAAVSGNYTQGSLNSTGSSTDVALNGNGYFVVAKGASTEFTRAGNFSLDNQGNLVTSDGLSVMGYPSVNGVVNTNSPLAAINIPVGQVEQPHASTTMMLTANLDASSAVGTNVPAQITLYDSLGVGHVATVTFTNKGAGSWDYSIALPAGEATGATTNTTGTLTFDSSGNLKLPAANVSGISFAGMSDGAADLTMNWQLYGANQKAAISQVASASAVDSTSQDGFASGQYKSFTIDSKGIISATFDNGQQTAVGQLAIATVTNDQGLARLGSNNYDATLASGQASVGVAGAGGRAMIQDGALEQSNVDISTEFSSLIVAQRAFEANSKSVTTFDTVTQETINMIH